MRNLSEDLVRRRYGGHDACQGLFAFTDRCEAAEEQGKLIASEAGGGVFLAYAFF